MSKLQRYLSYKDSGVEWIGEIPEHWGISKLGICLKPISIKNRADLPLLSVTREQGVILRDTENKEENHNFIPDDLSGYKLVIRGQFAMNKMKAWQGSFGISPYTGIVSPAYYIFELNGIEPDFFHKAIRSKTYIPFFIQASDGVRIGQWDLSKTRMKEIPFYVPLKQEQTAIASFLDEKTAQIDQAISQKEKMIELLKERRQIVINEAVTRGINPDTSMKESGVEWIGEIPEHWEVKKLKFIIKNKLKYGANESGISYDEELPRYVRITDFSDSGKLSEKNKLSLTWEKGRDYLLKDGDILFARSGGTVGKTYQFKRSMSSEKNYAFAGYLIKAEANEKTILSDYLYLYTNSNLFNKWKESIFNKATIENIGADKYSELYFTLPPLEEQKRILEQYFVNGSKIDTAIELQQNYIGKLKEYKATLIDSVVTGKVRVA